MTISNFALTLLFLLPCWIFAQNFVVNPDFENIDRPVQSSGEIALADGWSSPNIGSPELIGSDSERFVYDPYGTAWRFKPKSGSHVAGMNVFGSNGEDPEDHDRAYIQGSLSKPLEIGKKYYFSFWVHYHCEGANNIGIAFLPEKLSLSSEGQIDLMPAAWQHEVTPYSTRKAWTQVVDSFVAYRPYSFFVIGNFCSDEDTEVQNSPGGHHFAYIDNVEVLEAENSKMPPQIATRGNESANDWGENVRRLEQMKRTSGLNTSQTNIGVPAFPPNPIDKMQELSRSVVYFDLDQSLLDQEDREILDNLVASMITQPDVRIMALGFASREGGSSYNLSLSQQRAEAVRNYLVEKGIATDRVMIRAIGEAASQSSGNSEPIQAQNRRVEFRILW